MEEFLKLKWKIEGPHELDCGSEFIPEEEILNSYIYKQKFINDKKKSIEVKTLKPLTKSYAEKKYKIKSAIKSFLNVEEQSKCLKALHILQTGQKGLNLFDKGCIELYNNVQHQIGEENQTFLEFAKKKFHSTSIKSGFTKPIQTYANVILKKQLEWCKEYPQHYKEIDTLLYCYKEDETSIKMVHLANLLEVGILAKFTRPTLLTPCHISTYNFPNIFETYYSNLPVSKDINAKKLLESCEAEIVISSSGLKKILNFTEINNNWDIPVVVEEINLTTNDGITIRRNVVFIDKPLPTTEPTKMDIIQRTLKLALKTNFCTIEALKYSGVEEPINTKHEELNATKNKKKGPSADEGTSHCRKINHNASYRMWHLKQEVKQSELMKTNHKTKDVKVLVRSKLDACEPIESSMLQPVTLCPKLELQPEFGATIPSKAELIGQWTSLFFKPFSQVCRVRIAWTTKEVLLLENCNIQKVNNELHTHYDYKPSLGLGVLYKLFLELKTLSPGNYLLHHLPKHGTFVSLLQSCNENGIYDLYERYNMDSWKISEKKNEWCPIDCNLILPKHFSLEQMPGLFPPSLKIKRSNFKPIKKKKKPTPKGKLSKQRINKKESAIS